MEEIQAVFEHNAQGVMLWAVAFPGAFARGADYKEAAKKLPGACRRYRLWATNACPAANGEEVKVILEYKTEAVVEDGDTDVLFPGERLPMSMADYTNLKSLALKSARDFKALYESVPQKDRSLVKSRKTFYGRIPASAREMLSHANSVTAYYGAGVGIEMENLEDIVKNRQQLLGKLEQLPAFLQNTLYTAPDGELWTVKKLLRRLIWHDRIHARALYRRAVTFWAKERIANPFGFSR